MIHTWLDLALTSILQCLFKSASCGLPHISPIFLDTLRTNGINSRDEDRARLNHRGRRWKALNDKRI